MSELRKAEPTILIRVRMTTKGYAMLERHAQELNRATELEAGDLLERAMDDLIRSAETQRAIRDGKKVVTAKPTGPFGLIEQRESEYLTLAGVDARDRELLRAIRMRLDGRSQACHDTVKGLAWWSGMSERQAQYGLKTLVAAGLIKREGKAVRGGPRGHTWTWTTRPVPYAEWPVDVLASRIASMHSYVTVFYRPDEDAPPAPSSAMRPHRTNDEDAQNVRSGRRTTRHSPERPPEVSPERDDLFEESDEEDARSDDPRTLGKLWVRLRADAGRDRFLDDTAVRWLTERVPEALAVGCTSLDIERAVRRHAEESFADPRKLLEWASTERDERLRTERDLERSRQHALQYDQEQAEFARLRAEPGYQEKLDQAIAESRAKLGLPPRVS